MEHLPSNEDVRIYKIGMEFAFEGIEKEYFKANNEIEQEMFNKGYEEGQRLATQSKEEVNEEDIMTSIHM